MESLKDKVVLITGASSGIGAATAVEFAKYGSRLVLTGRNVDNLNKTAQQCQDQGVSKENILTVSADLAIDEDVKKIVDEAVSKFGAIDILVNNAVTIANDDWESPSVEVLDTMYRVNLRAVVFLTKLVIPYLKKNKGSVVNISSMVGTIPNPLGTSYGMLKAALNMFTKDLALELAKDGVRVNTISFGFVKTPSHHLWAEPTGLSLEEYFKFPASMTPLGKVATASEAARSVTFLASDASSFTTGADLAVDGGFMLTAAWTPKNEPQ